MKNIQNILIATVIAVGVTIASSNALLVMPTTNLRDGITNDNTNGFLIPNAEATRPCTSVAQAQTKTSLPIKASTFLPAGYKLQCADADQLSGYVLYWDQVFSPQDTIQDPVMKGAILVQFSLHDNSTDPAYGIKNKTKEITSIYNDFGPQHHPRLTKIQGNLAVVREKCTSCGVAEAKFADGTKIVSNFALPSMIIYYEGDILYKISGNVPSTDLERVANSLR